MNKEEIKQENNELINENELTPEQWSLIEKASEEIKNGKYHTYAEVKEHFEKYFSE